MKFRITGDMDKVKPFIQQFCDEAKKEYEVQTKKVRSTPMPFGLKVPDMPFEIGWFEENNNIIFWNTIPMPKILLKSVVGKRAIKKMQKNLQGFLNTNNIECKIEFIGE
jgi:hypothetical protein